MQTDQHKNTPTQPQSVGNLGGNGYASQANSDGFKSQYRSLSADRQKQENAHALGAKIRDEATFEGATRRAMTTAEMTRQAVEDRKQRTGYQPKEPDIPAFGSFWAGITGNDIPPPELLQPKGYLGAAPVKSSSPYGVLKTDAAKPQGGYLNVVDPLAIGSPDAPITPVAGDSYQAVMPKNGDHLATEYLREHSQPADGDLNAGNRKMVPGLDGVSYAGQYGKTDVFAGVTYDENGDKVVNFSDTANLATTRGGAAAPVPEGNTAVTNTSPATLYDQQDLNKDGLPDQTSPELQQERQAAIARGDYQAVDRSYMTSEQRAAEDEQNKIKNYRDVAAKKDPVGTYLGVLDAKARQDAGYAKYAKELEQQRLNTIRDNRSQSTYQNAVIKQAWGYLQDLMGDGLNLESKEAQKAVQQGQAVLIRLAKQYPDLDPMALSQKAIQEIQNPSETVATPNAEADAFVDLVLSTPY